MSGLKTLFKQTFIYGLATVLPRMLSFLLVRLHTDESVLKSVADYGDVSLIFSYFVLFNVILAYGMERNFVNNEEKEKFGKFKFIILGGFLPCSPNHFKVKLPPKLNPAR